MTEPKELRTIKKSSEVTGCSERFFWYLIEQGKLTKYKINDAALIDLNEFYSIARASKKEIRAYTLEE